MAPPKVIVNLYPVLPELEIADYDELAAAE